MPQSKIKKDGLPLELQDFSKIKIGVQREG